MRLVCVIVSVCTYVLKYVYKIKYVLTYMNYSYFIFAYIYANVAYDSLYKYDQNSMYFQIFVQRIEIELDSMHSKKK